MQDYEFAGLQRQIAFRLARRVLVPDSIPLERLAKDRRQGAASWSAIPGLKEEYYLADFEPDPAVLDELGLDREKVLVVVRPPPETSEYHARNDLYGATIDRLAAATEAQAVVIPRTERQGAAVRALGAANLIVPERAIDAQSLIAYADLVVSAGGTMNREAVALGTPVFTTFAGRMGGVDEALIADGRLQVLADPAALRAAQARGAGRRPPPARPRAAGRRRRSGLSRPSSSLSRPALRHGHSANGPDDHRRRPRLPR